MLGAAMHACGAVSAGAQTKSVVARNTALDLTLAIIPKARVLIAKIFAIIDRVGAMTWSRLQTR